MRNIIAFFKRIIEVILKILFGKYEPNFVAFDGDGLITLDGKTFLVKEEK